MAENNKARANGAEAARQAVVAARRADRRRAFIIWGAVAVLGLSLVGVATKVLVDASARNEAVKVAVAAPIDGVVESTKLSANHVANLPEPTPTAGVLMPPVGGDHDAVPQNCGVYGAPVGTWHAVHSLEHGAVWVTYAPAIAADEVAKLSAAARNHDHVLVSPFPNLASPIVLTAWGLQLRLDSASDPRVETFIKKYENGPQTPEPGAPCSGGVGQPTG
jgi:Protein of unknown function (DUF3105)